MLDFYAIKLSFSFNSLCYFRLMPNAVTRSTDSIQLIDICAGIFLIGMVCSKALLAIGMVIFCLAAIFQYGKSYTREAKTLSILLMPAIIFGATILSGINSEDLSVWGEFIAKKVPFLLLPIAFYLAKERMAYRYYDFLMAFVIIVAVVSLGVLTNYLMNFEVLNEAIGRGKAITTPIDHTEFSIFVAFAAVVSLYLYVEEKRVVRIGTRSTLLMLCIFLVLFLHILAVRSGLAVLYITFFLMAVYTFVKSKRYGLLAGSLLLMMLLPLVAVNVVPSLKTKLDYVNWDFHRHDIGKGVTYSDSERIYSLQAGLEIFRGNMIIGTGIGDLKHECQKIYQRRLGKVLEHYPHNQYLFVLSGLGVVGFIFYSIALLGPLVRLRGHYDPYFLTLHCVVFVSALVENTIERTFSIGFYLFFVLAGICYLTRKWAQPK